MLPRVAQGQTVSQKEGTTWRQLFWKGGMVRSADGRYYLSVAEGMGDLVVMNYVDGYSYGPHVTLGIMDKGRNRWEMEQTVRYATSRKTWVAKGALRWYSPVERGAMLELHGGQHTEDFDRDPVMSTSQSLMATGVFGWNHYKLLERTDAGLRAAWVLANDLDVQMSASWERRRQVENHRSTNAFGAHGQSNIPRVYDDEQGLRLWDTPVNGQLALLGLEIHYQPYRRYVVYDDMTCQKVSSWPLFTLKADAGVGDWNYLSLEAQMGQTLQLPRRTDELQYQVNAGGIFSNHRLGLADWHHFDASPFWWQDNETITRFALIDNYERSTDKGWCEAHVQWTSDCLALSWLTRDPAFLQEYLQLHTLTSATGPFHWEAQYGINLVQMLRLGVAMGWDKARWLGAAFTMTLKVN